MILELKNVCKTNCFNNINFSLLESQIIYTNNPTLFKVILKLIKLDSGLISYFSKTTKKDFLKALNYIGYSSILRCKNPKQTVIEYLNYSNSYYEANFSENINYYLNLFKLDETKKINQLDKTEIKKLSLINSFFFNPKLILLEDPFSDLDYSSILCLTKTLYELKRNGSSIIYSGDTINQSFLIDDTILIFNNEQYQIDPIKLKSYKRITIHTNNFQLKSLDSFNIYNLTINDDLISFITNSNINSLIKKLDNYNIDDIYVSNPSINEIKELYEQEINQ